eukprot:m.191863 g.191863  ORF g.191863 m.191863 type:complete len:365 (+) comp14848_c0_seq1:243-1337(+)
MDRRSMRSSRRKPPITAVESPHLPTQQPTDELLSMRGKTFVRELRVMAGAAGVRQRNKMRDTRSKKWRRFCQKCLKDMLGASHDQAKFAELKAKLLDFGLASAEQRETLARQLQDNNRVKKTVSPELRKLRLQLTKELFSDNGKFTSDSSSSCANVMSSKLSSSQLSSPLQRCDETASDSEVVVLMGAAAPSLLEGSTQSSISASPMSELSSTASIADILSPTVGLRAASSTNSDASTPTPSQSAAAEKAIQDAIVTLHRRIIHSPLFFDLQAAVHSQNHAAARFQIFSMSHAFQVPLDIVARLLHRVGLHVKLTPQICTSQRAISPFGDCTSVLLSIEFTTAPYQPSEDELSLIRLAGVVVSS